MSTRYAAVSLCLSFAVACGPRPVELGFWMAPISYEPARLGRPITPAEYLAIDQTARIEIADAFRDFEVTLTANRNAPFKVEVVPSLTDHRLIRGGTYAGESRAVAGFGGAGHVNFEYVANGAMVFAPDDATRPEIIAALGRGIGRVAIHEFLHQLLPKSPIHDATDVDSYEGNSPAQIQGYFGDLRWGIARPWLEGRIKLKS